MGGYGHRPSGLLLGSPFVLNMFILFLGLRALRFVDVDMYLHTLPLTHNCFVKSIVHEDMILSQLENLTTEMTYIEIIIYNVFGIIFTNCSNYHELAIRHKKS